MKTTARFIVFHPSVHKTAGGGGGGGSRGTWLAVFVLFFVFTFAFTLLNTSDKRSSGSDAYAAASVEPRLPESVVDALLHYAAGSNETGSSGGRMSPTELQLVAAVIRRCAPCNVLVFGLTHETLLWRSLNHGGGGRTVFVDESAYLVGRLEERHPAVEAYDVQFTTTVGELPSLLAHARAEAGGECRPVQNLLFSECRLAVNDLPNHVYDVAWDVILVDGPRGYSAASPGRMAAIFTAGVLTRSKRGGARETHVLVHEIGREVERVCSDEFLCRENLVEIKESLGHFVIPKSDDQNNDNWYGFCSSVSSKMI